MFSRFSSLIAIVPLLVLANAPTPAAAADYSGCSPCGGDYQVDYGAPSGGDYFNSDTDFSKADPNANFVLRGSMGMTSIHAVEKVYHFTTGDDLLSRLDWQSVAPIASGDAKIRLPGDWTLRGHVDAAIAGDSNMIDYDWLGFSPSLAPDDWDHRSISPNTHLDWYLNGSVALGRDLPINESLTINVNGGLKYTDVQWTAVGGTYLYSVNAFRDTPGTLPDVPGITYHMRLPTAFVGMDAAVRDGAWSLDTTAKYGVTFLAGDTDYHYLRNLRFEDQLNWSQVLSADARLGYNFNDHLGAFLEGSYEKVLSGHNDSNVYDIPTGAHLGYSPKLAGAELDVASVKVGLKGNF